MKLLTKKLKTKLLRNAKRTRAYQRGALPEPDHFPVVKLFTPDAQATWLLTELDPDDEDTLFGLCDSGTNPPELGYVSLRELTKLRGHLGLPVERDLHFKTNRPLSEHASLSHSKQPLEDYI